MLVIQRPTVEAIDEQVGNRQRFAVSPLEPGFGHTLGNSLRRTLLSSIPGAGVTQVRFDDALHEFTTIKGVTEDITDIILNLKDLVLQVYADEAVTLRLDAKGTGANTEVTAADIQPHADVDILNADLHIATLSTGARLAIDITVAKGRGYVSADRNKTTTTIGVIPVDSIFSPVRRVAYQVEQMTERRDRLILEVETNGAITPRDALSSAAKTLIGLIEPFADLGEAQGLAMGAGPEERSTSPDLDLPIEALDLTERPRNCLKRAQVNTIGELVERTEDDLLAITNFGQKSLDEVLQKLDERGLALRSKEG